MSSNSTWKESSHRSTSNSWIVRSSSKVGARLMLSSSPLWDITVTYLTHKRYITKVFRGDVSQKKKREGKQKEKERHKNSWIPIMPGQHILMEP